MFIIRCLHDATQLGKAEDRAGVPTSVLRSSSMLFVESQWLTKYHYNRRYAQSHLVLYMAAGFPCDHPGELLG